MIILEAVGLLTVGALFLYYWMTKRNDYWAKRGIPFEKPVPFVGCLGPNLMGKKSNGQIIQEIYNKFKGEKVVGLFFMSEPVLMLRDPDLSAQILTTDYHNFAKNNFPIDETQDPVVGKNMFVQSGEKWKHTRQALSPAFTAGKIKANFDKILKQADRLVQYLVRTPEVEAKAALSLYTTEVVADTGLGIDGHSFTDKNATLPQLGKLIFNLSWFGTLKFTIMIFLPTISKFFKLRFAPKLVYDFFDDMLRDLIKSRENETVKRTDLLQYYIDLRKKRLISRNDDQKEISEDDIVAGIVSFFLEGYETSSVITSFILLHLVNDQPLLKKVQQEVDDLYARTKGELTMESIIELPLLHRVWQETLRFYGAEMMNKVCTRTCELDLGDGRKLQVEEGTSVVIPLSSIQKDPLYWDNAEKFDPDRFLEQNQANRRKGVYFPFSDGPRICIGMRMAHTSIKTVIVKLVRHFDLVRTPKTATKFVQDPMHFMTAQLGGVHMKFVKRDLPSS